MEHLNFIFAANCIIRNVKLPSFAAHTNGRVYSDMFTDGLVRLLSGSKIELHPQDKAIYYKENKERKKSQWDIFNPICPDSIDGIMWSPYTDCVSFVPQARSLDYGSFYPYVHSSIYKTFGYTGGLSENIIISVWKDFINITKDIPKKGLFIYPTDFIDDCDSTHLRNKTRVDGLQACAVDLFAKAGWKLFKPSEPIKISNDNWWAHLTDDSISNMTHDARRNGDANIVLGFVNQNLSTIKEIKFCPHRSNVFVIVKRRGDCPVVKHNWNATQKHNNRPPWGDNEETGDV